MNYEWFHYVAGSLSQGLTLNENEVVPMINEMFINCTIILSQFDKRHYQYICSSHLEDNLETPRTIKKHI